LPYDLRRPDTDRTGASLTFIAATFR